MPEPWWEEARSLGHASVRGLRVAVYGSGGAPMHHAALAAFFGATPMVRTAQDIRTGGLADVDVFVMPGGGARAMGGLLEPLGEDGAAALNAWVRGGGMYVGSCAGAFLPARAAESFWRANPAARALHMVPAPLANASDSVWEGLTSPGVGRVVANVAAAGHWLARGLPPTFELVHYNGPMFRIDPAAVAAGTTEGVVRFAGRTPGFTPSEAFLVGPRDGAEPEAAGATLFERCAAEGAFTAVASRHGDGTVVLFGSHPEFGFDTLQLGWGPGARLFLNALMHQADRTAGASTGVRTAVPGARPQAETDGGAAGASAWATHDRAARNERGGAEGGGVEADRIASDLLAASADLDEAAAAADGLRGRAGVARWLEPGIAPSFLGLDPATLWERALREGAGHARETAEYLRALADRARSDEAAAAALAALEPWRTQDAPEGQDYGAIGLVPLTGRIRDAVQRGTEALAGTPTPLAHAYDQFDTHPFQILVGSYLAVTGLIASAALVASVLGLAAAPDLTPPTGPAPEVVAA